MQDGIVRQIFELDFTVFPYGFTLQFFDLIAAVLNCVAQILGLDIKFIGL